MLIKTELIAFRTEPQLADQLRQAAVKHDRPQSWLIRKALENFLQKENKSTVSEIGGMNGAFVGTN